jgi:methionyl-tRNA formyltransferase
LRIVFMGTPDFAMPSLDQLLEKGYQVVLVVTQPDKPKGRGKKLSMPPVKELAISHKIDVFQPNRLKSQEVMDRLKSYSPDFFVTAAYGKILPKEILDIPKFGCINVHASLLPSYRGAAPIQWSIVKGELSTGITTMLMDEGLDTGDILLKEEVKIEADMTGGELHDILASVGAKLLIKTLRDLRDGKIEAIPQDHTRASYAPLLKKEDGLIDWTKKSAEIHAGVRGFNPYPGAYTFYEGQKMRIWKTSVETELCVEAPPGTILGVSRDGVMVSTGDYAIRIEEVQFDSCRRMCVGDYLCGNKIHEGEMLGS